jgi:hypothetical protein
MTSRSWTLWVRAGLALLLVAGGVSVCVGSGWERMSRESLAAIRVGDPMPYWCCIRSTYTPCDYNCVSNPYCPKGKETSGPCSNATCVSNPNLSSVCSTPSNLQWFTTNRCRTTGEVHNCNTSPATGKCKVDYLAPGLLFQLAACNVGESLCDAQPFLTCDQPPP